LPNNPVDTKNPSDKKNDNNKNNNKIEDEKLKKTKGKNKV
jgi:hypothetical protein